MAVTFKANGESASYVIGGQTTVSGDGVAGPFPTYGISTEINRADNVPLNNKYTINMTGTALISDGSMLSAGARQGLLHKEIDEVLKLKSKIGILEINPYGGDANKIKFTDARVISVDLAEQSEESAGVQFQNYNFVFEAYRKFKPTDSLTAEDSADKLQGVVGIEESWDVSLLEEYSEFSIPVGGGDISATSTPFKVWSITHNISAVGVATGSAFTDDTTTTTDNTKAMGYINAKAWVESRLKGNPLLNDSTVKDLKEFNIDLVVPNQADATNPYKTYNHVRTINQDIIAGSYSVVDTWTASRYPASHTIDYSFDRPEEAEYDTVTVNLNVQGLETASDGDVLAVTTTSDRYVNALLNFDLVKTSVHAGAATFYSTVGGGGTLKTSPVSHQRTDNETLGTISYTATFNDEPEEDGNANDVSLTVTYNNTDHEVDATGAIVTQGNQIVAIIPVLAKSDGPVIQDMQTTNEKTISVSYSKTMKKEWRDTNKPTENISVKPNGDSVVNQYKPEGGYRQNRVESWNPYNGQYNLDVDWVFTDNFSYDGGGDPDDPTKEGWMIVVCACDTAEGGPSLNETFKVRKDGGASGAIDAIVKFFTSDGQELCGRITQEIDLADDEEAGSKILNTYIDCFDCCDGTVLG